MATLVLTAVGTALGGPLGGALGAVIGNQFDQALGGQQRREGPRLKELAVTTSSYGAAIARHYGQVRTPGTIIWATDLVESSEEIGGGKGKPSVKSYSYSASFAVALASRPIKGIGKIWADGSLLRGVNGDLKVGGDLRIYHGHGDQAVDPLIATDRGEGCPAFRNTAYCVFESLHLGDFGNRIPGLTFEIIADDGAISIEAMMAGLDQPVEVDRPVHGLVGFSDEGGAIAGTLATIDQVYPINVSASQKKLRLSAGERISGALQTLPEPVAAVNEGESFGAISGQMSRRRTNKADAPCGIRYYDVDRDFQAGLQRVDGRAYSGSDRLLEFPGALPSSKAKQLASSAYQRSVTQNETLSWRIAEIDPGLEPGQVVLVPNRQGHWRIQSWEWREDGIELELVKLPPDIAQKMVAEAGEILAPPDKLSTPTVLYAFELPWNGVGSPETAQIFAAASSVSSGWTGAALYAEREGALSYLRGTESRRSIVGSLVGPIAGTESILLDDQTVIKVSLLSPEFELSQTTIGGLAEGGNRLLVGDEVLQFARAKEVRAGVWELSHLLRGRGGTEAAALRGHEAGSMIALLDDRPTPIDDNPPVLPPFGRLAAIGLADDAPVVSEINNLGISRRPLAPVHVRKTKDDLGNIKFSWVRRSRGAWEWSNSEVPLNENSERYLVGLGRPDALIRGWETSITELILNPETIASMERDHGGAPIWVRQIGSYSSSDPTLLDII